MKEIVTKYESKIKIDFAKLIGNKYLLEIKMAVLDWMLNTGIGYDHQYGLNVDVVNKSLLGYSANNHDVPVFLPKNKDYSLFFDAVFARAIYAQENKSLKSWREKNSIIPGKSRILKFKNGIPDCKKKNVNSLVYSIQDFEGKILKKEHHHPDYENRTEPKIIEILIYTIGKGWVVQYMFSFKEHTYEPGWTKSFYQNDDESIWQFLKRSYDKLSNFIIDD